MNYCSQCGQPVSLLVPEGDTLPRHVCTGCGTIHYRNPLIVVGAIPVWEGKILLCRRSIEPRKGYWTLPAGFMENDESMQEGAARETREEALADIEVGELFATVNVIHVNQVHIMFLARMLSPEHGPGEESLESELLLPADIPWADLAFPSISFTLERYLQDLERGSFGLHTTTIRRRRSKG
ncbi:MAG: NUDIX hydrolase [Gammaproteobacteria bacterium]|nr:NUDIX hydrolase [Gammaproteobacteria bacterium]